MTKEIKDYPDYTISTNGVVTSYKCSKSGRVLKCSPNSYGYPTVCLTNESGEKMLRVHRFVAEAFIPNYEDKRCVNHINGIKTDNRVENLEWNTHSENNKHACMSGLRRSTTHLTSRVVELREEGMTYQAIADELGCAYATAYKYSNK